MIRVHGRMKRMNLPVPTAEEMEEEIQRILSPEQWERLLEMKEIDLSQKLEDLARFRVNVYSQINGYGVAFRTIPSDILGFEELGLPEILKDLALRDRGLIIFTGPTGCGKSTSLAACIDYINEYKEQHIITVEDPIEYYHSSRNCLINQRELGANTHSFANALRQRFVRIPM